VILVLLHLAVPGEIELPTMSSRRVVISGLGTVTGLGVGATSLWEGLLAGRSALGPITRFDTSGHPCRLAGEVKDFSAKDHVPKYYRKAVKVMARDIELAVGAAKFAVEDAGLVTRATLAAASAGADVEGEATGQTTYPAGRIGCQIGAGLIAMEADEIASALASAKTDDLSNVNAGGFDVRAWGTRQGGTGGMNNLQPLWLLKYLPNMLACHVTILHGAEGPSNTITCQEASGLLSIGESVRVIQRGAADLCFSGGAESKINLMGVFRMNLAGRLAETGVRTDGGSLILPYDPAATGGLLGEGAGIIILEEFASAKARGTKIYAEVAGFGAGQSGPEHLHLAGRAVPAGVDEGLQGAIESALSDAGVRPDEIDAIVPHASGIPEMDATEADTLRAVFGGRLASIPLVTLNPNLGDAMAGNGGLAVAVGAMCILHQTLPARIHAGQPASDLQAGATHARQAKLRNVLVCTSALGGQNAALVLRNAR